MRCFSFKAFFVNLPKSDRFLRHVCVSAWKKNCASIRRIYIVFDTWGFYQNLSKKINFHEKNRTRKLGTWHEDQFTGMLISPLPDQEGNKLERQKILSFIYPIYNHNWRNISTIYIYNKTSIKRNILTIKQNTSGSRSG